MEIKINLHYLMLLFLLSIANFLYILTDIIAIPIVVGVFSFVLFILRLKLKLFDYFIILVPVMFYIRIPFTVNASVADIVLIALIFIFCFKRSNSTIVSSIDLAQIKSKRLVIYYGVGLIVIMILSLVNIFRLDAPLVLESFVAIFKIVICLIYAIFTLKYLKLYGKERFLMVNTYTAVAFSLVMIVGVMAYKGGLDLGLTFSGTFRATGTFEDPNLAATYLFIMSAFVFSYFSMKKKYIALLFSFILILVAIILTASKGALVSLSVGLFLTLFIMFFRGKIVQGMKVFTVILFGFTFLLIIITNTEWAKEVTDPIFERYGEFTNNLSEDHSLTHRKFLWDIAFELGLNNPILGVGIEQYRPAASELTGVRIWNIVHNTYLTFWSELGIIGFMAFIWIWVFILIKNIKYLRIYRYSTFYLFSIIAVSIAMYSISLGNFRVFWMFIAFLIYEIYSLENKNLVNNNVR